MQDQKLIEAARKAQKNAYAPYSKVKVGAALLTKSGNLYIGCNVENVRYGELLCAERNAIFNAMTHGETELISLVIIANYRGILKPCRPCRSVISESCPTIKIMTINTNNNEVLNLELKDLYKDKFSFRIRSIIRMLIRKIFR